ncbi:MAG: MarR family transcriptional regulator, partial [Chloroflexi bacterium]|nr:MarR family transcriptional regulator [Chloroflexota bacterium]
MDRRRDAEGHGEASEAAQNYLLTLRSMAGGTATTTVLARRMGVSKQAASQMMGRLVAEGYAHLSEGREISLTPAGQEAADTIFRRHALLEWLLT